MCDAALRPLAARLQQSLLSHAGDEDEGGGGGGRARLGSGAAAGGSGGAGGRDAEGEDEEDDREGSGTWPWGFCIGAVALCTGLSCQGAFISKTFVSCIAPRESRQSQTARRQGCSPLLYLPPRRPPARAAAAAGERPRGAPSQARGRRRAGLRCVRSRLVGSCRCTGSLRESSDESSGVQS